LLKLSERKCARGVTPVQLLPSKVAIPDFIPPVAAAPSLPTVPSQAGRPKLFFLVTEDWYFCSHRLPIARAARDFGFTVVVATRVRAHGGQILDEGFTLRPLAWRRRGDGLLGAARAIFQIVRLYRTERPDLVHHIALKPVLFGGIARHLAFGGSPNGPVVIDSIMGLGSGFSDKRFGAALRRSLLAAGLRFATHGTRRWVIAQNPEDRAELSKLGIDANRIALIRGSGVDTGHFTALPDPETRIVTVALVSRMLREKGVLDAVAAIRLLRARGLRVQLLLAGPVDLDNRDSLTNEQLASLGAEPGIEWLGQVADVRAVWRRAAIALLPSTYGEGVPKALLEAAACARPIVATDVPGCREVVRHGETGILVPPHNLEPLADAIATLVDDPVQRHAMGRAGRALVERNFAEQIIARETLALYCSVSRESVALR
jgi:glycosyltransferase involved in cell wall biosynthesis